MKTAVERHAVATAPFDRPEEYDAILSRGIRLSGEGKLFFIEGRLADMRRRLPAGWAPRRILDFGCGTGDTTAALKRVFPAAYVVGLDAAATALASARAAHASAGVTFADVGSLGASQAFDLCYVNGVFHHIAPAERLSAAAMIREALTPRGLLVLFENNPWNPGTRMVMSRIAFDRNAQTLTVFEARRLLYAAGFRTCSAGRFLFYFPNALRVLRVVEPWLVRVPLGAQYWVMAAK